MLAHVATIAGVVDLPVTADSKAVTSGVPTPSRPCVAQSPRRGRHEFEDSVPDSRTVADGSTSRDSCDSQPAMNSACRSSSRRTDVYHARGSDGERFAERSPALKPISTPAPIASSYVHRDEALIGRLAAAIPGPDEHLSRGTTPMSRR